MTLLPWPRAPTIFADDEFLQRDRAQIDAGQPALPVHRGADVRIELAGENPAGAITAKEDDFSGSPKRFTSSNV